MVGERDQTDVSGVADVLKEKIATAEKLMVSGAAHIINLEQPTIFNVQVLNFLNRIDAKH
jgi:hypothetical protein